jgi:formylglycine-generating enzyme required for sulfatase activity
MLRRWHAAAVIAIAACRIPDLAFHRPDAVIDDDGPGEDPGQMTPPPPPPPSCDGLGLCGLSGDSCCTSLPVPAGAFYRDHDVANDPPLSGGLSYPAAISDFQLDKYDVTVGRFRQFVLAGRGTQVQPPAAGTGAHVGFPNSGWDPSWNTSLSADTQVLIHDIKCSSDQTWTDLPASSADENRPINCLTWYEAMAFCIWDGGYLPSEAEWNYAAMGGGDQRAYPWSVPAGSLMIDPTYTSFSPDGGANCSGDGMPGCSVTDMIPVGTLPRGNGRWGHSDLAGNVYQWVFDWSTVYGTACDGGCPDSAAPSGTDPLRAMRGGAFVYGADKLRGGARSNSAPWKRNYIIGTRCARPM